MVLLDIVIAPKMPAYAFTTIRGNVVVGFLNVN
jgi:hypothetical protein